MKTSVDDSRITEAGMMMEPLQVICTPPPDDFSSAVAGSSRAKYWVLLDTKISVRTEIRRPSVTEGMGGVGAGVGGTGVGVQCRLTGESCSVISYSWPTTWLMAFLDPLAPCKPEAELVSNNLESTECIQIIHGPCITSP